MLVVLVSEVLSVDLLRGHVLGVHRGVGLLLAVVVFMLVHVHVGIPWHILLLHPVHPPFLPLAELRMAGIGPSSSLTPC